MGTERRRFPRIALKILVDSRGPGIWQNAESANISQGGIFLSTDKIEASGSALELNFDFGKNQKLAIQANAVVAWSRMSNQYDSDGKLMPAGMGLQFARVLPHNSDGFVGRQIAQWDGNE